MTHTYMRTILRGIPVLRGTSFSFEIGSPPACPYALFEAWLFDAIERGVVEPHAMTLSTIGDDGTPDARTLILKDVSQEGFSFATSGGSQKAAQLDAHPSAALTFYWPTLGRQIRVRGAVALASEAERETDFAERSPGAKALAMVGMQSQPLDDVADLKSELGRAKSLSETAPEGGCSNWHVYRLTPSTIEFWQADAERLHQRLQYQRTDTGFRSERLWP